jgi:hypothetical protein
MSFVVKMHANYSSEWIRRLFLFTFNACDNIHVKRWKLSWTFTSNDWQACERFWVITRNIRLMRIPYCWRNIYLALWILLNFLLFWMVEPKLASRPTAPEFLIFRYLFTSHLRKSNKRHSSYETTRILTLWFSLGLCSSLKYEIFLALSVHLVISTLCISSSNVNWNRLNKLPPSQLRLLGAAFSPHSLGFDVYWLHERFMEEKSHWNRVFSEFLKVSTATHHYTAVPRSSITAPWGVR